MLVCVYSNLAFSGVPSLLLVLKIGLITFCAIFFPSNKLSSN